MKSLLLIAFIFQNATLFTVYPASAFEEKSHSVHLQWIIGDERLVVTCNVSEPFLPIVFYKDNIEDARCVPLPEPVCTNTIPGRSASFIRLTNQTIYTIEKFNAKNVNGEWSCSHGSGGKNPRDSEKVNVCEICARVYAAMSISQFCIIVLICIIHKCMKNRKKREENNTKCGRVSKNAAKLKKTCLYDVYESHCIKDSSFEQIVFRVMICAVLLGLYFAIVIPLVECSCDSENYIGISAGCIVVGIIIDMLIYIIWTAMKEDRKHWSCCADNGVDDIGHITRRNSGAEATTRV